MQKMVYFGREKSQHKDWLGSVGKQTEPYQAIETAMKANKNINTAPARGKTIGIMGTMESTGSSSTAGTSWACALWASRLEWSTDLDMTAPKQVGN
jgi:hypothetical protein